ncbi:MAG: radical SAM protein [Patescibacteria group bacterium]|jgi:radical SAM superfamily enzyme YgiQ (UPF0313 family)
MKVLFLFPIIENLAAFNSGVGSIAAVLKQNHHDVRVYVIRNTSYHAIKKEIEDYKPDVLAISCYTNYWSYIKETAARIKRDFNLPIFVGGKHAILFPNCLTETKDIDGLCVGEGEYSLLNIIKKLERGEDYRDVKNFWFWRDGKIIRNELDDLVVDLNTLPFPDRSAFPRHVVLSYPNLMFSRGCPYSCAYCCNSRLKQIFLGKGPVIRIRGADSAIEETERFVKEYHPTHLCFDDDSFTKDKQWLTDFCRQYRQRVGLPYYCNTRPELFDEETAIILRDSGCRSISIGIESGDEEYRKKYLNRYMLNEHIITAFALAKKHGLETSSFNMVGMPHETEASVLKTIELNRIIQPTDVQVSIYYPFPGTPLGDLSYREGFVTKKQSFNFINKSVLKLPDLTQSQIIHFAKTFQYEVFKKTDYRKAVYLLLRRWFIFSPVYQTYKRIQGYFVTNA